MNEFGKKLARIFKIYLLILAILTVVLSVVIFNGNNGEGIDAMLQVVPPFMVPCVVFVVLIGASIQFLLPFFIFYLIINIVFSVINNSNNQRIINNKSPEERKDLIINGQLIKKQQPGSDLSEAIDNFMEKTGEDVHVGRGSEVDALYRRKTGKSLSDISCHDCDDMNPWDEPKTGLFGFLKKRDSEQDDVEEYYRSRGIDHGKKR